MKRYLLADFGSTFTKLTAVDLEQEDILGTSKAITTVETNIIEGYQLALKRLEVQTGSHIAYDKILACSSAAGGLRMVAIGLVEELTTEAAKRVCLGAGAKVELVLSHNINKAEIQQIIDKKIDIVLLAGGANGGNRECVVHNAMMLARSSITAPIVFAGNKDAVDDVTDILSASHKIFFICENVMPRINQLNIESAKNTIKDIFVKNIIEAKGIKKVESLVDQVVFPTPHAVLMAAELLSKGFNEEEGLGDLMVVDVGGATTDVYSMGSGTPTQANAILSGLEEPFAKHTVEGDIGMRFSVLGALQAMTHAELHQLEKQGLQMKVECDLRFRDTNFIAETGHDYLVDNILAAKCVDAAMTRHVGMLKGIYTPMGMMYHQTGKDLTQVTHFIGTGGVVISSNDPRSILRSGTHLESKASELRPFNPEFLLDRDYILSAMGLLSLDHPEIALRIMKKRIIRI